MTRTTTYRWNITMGLAALLLVIGQLLLAAAPAFASPGAPPSGVPTGLEVPAGYTLLFSSRAKGMQIYSCVAGQWAFHAPRAALFDPEYDLRTIAHYGGIDRGFTAGPWWEAMRDGSRVRAGEAVPAPSPNPDSIPLLRLRVLEHAGSGVFDSVAYIQRLNTNGGVSPTGACQGEERREVPYTADYYFYAAGPIPAGVPGELAVPAGQVLLLAAHARGVQIYECVAGAWAFHAPRANLVDQIWGQPVALHYGGIDRDLTPGPWWQSKHDNSRIRAGNPVPAPSPNPDSIPLLRLQVLERTDGSFGQFNWIQRLNTVGGVSPTGACATGEQREVPYTADYYFYGD